MSVLFVTNGHPSDRDMLRLLWESGGAEVVSAVVVKGTPKSGYVHGLVDRGQAVQDVAAWAPVSLDELTTLAKAHEVTAIAPTVMGRDGLEEDVAVLAAQLGIAWPSRAAVAACADKQQFGQLRRQLGLATPASIECATEAEILRAIETIGPPVVLKPLASFGSRAVRIVPGDDADTPATVAWHVRERDGAQIKRTVVQEYVEAQEYGVTCMVDGGRVVDDFFLVTFKEMTGDTFRKEIAHVFDPADTERLRVGELIRADCKRLFEALHTLEPAAGMCRSFFNADVLVTRDDRVVTVDASPRLGVGGVTRIACAALGVACTTMTFERLCLEWALGRDVSFRPLGPAHAALVRTGFPDGGTVITTAQDPVMAMSIDGVFLANETSRQLGGRPMAPLQSIESTQGHPVIGAEGPDRAVAEQRWLQGMSALGLEVRRPDGTTMGYGDTGAWIR